jgi:hypothetical protein
MTKRETIAAKWQSAKPRVIALAVGLVVGPLLTNYFELQQTTGSARAQARAGVVEVQALFCEARARLENADPAKLDWTARNDLAKKWAALPGQTETDSDVTSACAGKLAS